MIDLDQHTAKKGVEAEDGLMILLLILENKFLMDIEY